MGFLFMTPLKNWIGNFKYFIRSLFGVEEIVWVECVYVCLPYAHIQQTEIVTVLQQAYFLSLLAFIA